MLYSSLSDHYIPSVTKDIDMDMIGKVFGKWKVIQYKRKDKKYNKYYLCRCECGEEKELRVDKLKYKTPTRCQSYTNITHNKLERSIYNIWKAMKYRCSNAKNKDYKYYGARGIKVCDRWLKFENFYEDMGERYPGHSLDRIDFNGNYEPSNCRWASATEQNRNKRRCIYCPHCNGKGDQ